MIRKDLFYCDEKKVPSDYFVGNVVIREAYNEVNSDDQELYFVEFLTVLLPHYISMNLNNF